MRRRVIGRRRCRFSCSAPLEQERFGGDLGERIGEAVAEIQSRRVAALAEVVEGLARQMRLLDGERLDEDDGPAEKCIALPDGVRADLAFNDHAEFQEVSGADHAAVRVMNELRVARHDRGRGA